MKTETKATDKAATKRKPAPKAIAESAAKAIKAKAESKAAKSVEEGGLVAIRSRFKNKFSPTYEEAVSNIFTDPGTFQGRTVPFSQATVNKIKREGYDTSQDPIVVWNEAGKPGGRVVVISGHSRYEAAKELGLKKIPVKIFVGDKEDAVDFAVLESNRGGNAEGVESDIKAYLRAKQRGYNKDFLRSIFKTDSYISTLANLSRLNPRGRFIEILARGNNQEEKDAKSFPYLVRNASWVGQLRGMYPELSDLHEQNFFDFFYKSEKGLKVKHTDFFEAVKKFVENPKFSATRPFINKIPPPEFDRLSEKSPEVVALRATETRLFNLRDARNNLERKIAIALLDKKPTEELFGQLAQVEKVVIDAASKFEKQRRDVHKEDERQQGGGLF